MKKISLWFNLVISSLVSFGQISYTLRVNEPSSHKIQVEIRPDMPMGDSLEFIMPRYVPGSYAGSNFHHYIENPVAITVQDSAISMTQGDFDIPRWRINSAHRKIREIRYTVDLLKMELQQADMWNTSYSRNNFVGLLNYSVFGWINGTENNLLTFNIETVTGWPIFSTINPKEKLPVSRESITCKNYYELADGQTMVGPGMKIREYKGMRPIFVAAYCETNEEYIDNYGTEAVACMELLDNYFGTIPFEHYTVVRWALAPLKPGKANLFDMEHLNSLTEIGDTTYLSLHQDTGDIRQYIFGILHHMGHGYIPLRCFGDTYKPYVTEIPLIIRNIWFNEGFIWFVCSDILKNPFLESFLARGAAQELPAIGQLGLIELSQLASLQYGDDFRIGIATFSRGAMMANEMNDYILKMSNGKKSMRDVFRYLFAWSSKNKRAFTLEEFPHLLGESTGIDFTSIYNKWLKPLL
jgi:predicted metalloprotease with PDZ domain